MKAIGSYDRIHARVSQLAKELQQSGERVDFLCDNAANDICNDLFTIRTNAGDEYIDCRIRPSVGYIHDRYGRKVDLLIEHGNLTTGEVVVVNTEKMSHTGHIEREIHQLEGPLVFTPRVKRKER